MRVFISYSHRDSNALDRLHVHLASLRRDKLIQQWFDREILAGADLDRQISEQLETSDIFLLLVSPDFLASDYCIDRELARALERHDEGTARVIPVIIEPCDWKMSKLGNLKAVPQDGKPVSEWTNTNNAYLDIVSEIRRILKDPLPHSTMVSLPDEIGQKNATYTRGYRLKKSFDKIDIIEYRESAFRQMKEYFSQSVQELNSIENLKGRFHDISTSSFGCIVVNRLNNQGTAHFTVHLGDSGGGLSDIYYSFSENSPRNSANGGFSVANDDYELYLVADMFGLQGNATKMTPRSAADVLWTKFVNLAGISCD